MCLVVTKVFSVVLSMLLGSCRVLIIWNAAYLGFHVIKLRQRTPQFKGSFESSLRFVSFIRPVWKDASRLCLKLLPYP